MNIRGRVWKFSDDVNTDAIIAARYLVTGAAAELGKYLMEDIRPGFSAMISPGDIIAAGENFGCGSSREHAPLAIKGAGIAAVVAKSFARIFYRNCFNMGLPIFECAGAVEAIEEGDEVRIDLESGDITDLNGKASYSARPIPPFMRELISAGGLINYMVEHSNERGKK